MKQLLLRVPDSVHAKIAARAHREGRSINAVATQILDAVASADTGDRRARLRACAASLGFLPPSVQTEPGTSRIPLASRNAALAAGAGIGAILDRLIEDGRDVLSNASRATEKQR